MNVDDPSQDHPLPHAAVQPVEPTPSRPHVAQNDQGRNSGDLDQMSFNTAIARMMEFTNFFLKEQPIALPSGDGEAGAIALALCWYMAEELWRDPGPLRPRSATSRGPRSTKRRSRKTPSRFQVQINGKLRGRVRVTADSDKATLESTAQQQIPKSSNCLAGKTVVKAIVVPGRMVNFVVK